MKVLNSIWFTQMGSERPIGIILAEDEKTGKHKSYIGLGLGISEIDDIREISMTGAKFPVDSAKVLFGVKE